MLWPALLLLAMLYICCHAPLPHHQLLFFGFFVIFLVLYCNLWFSILICALGRVFYGSFLLLSFFAFYFVPSVFCHTAKKCLNNLEKKRVD